MSISQSNHAASAINILRKSFLAQAADRSAGCQRSGNASDRLDQADLPEKISPMAHRQRQIGILGGMSDQSTHEYYRIINSMVNDRLGGWHTGEIVIASADFGIIEHCVRNDLWKEARDYLRCKVRALEAAGSDLLVCASNTMHRAALPLFDEIDLPYIHISDPTGEAIRAADLYSVAVIGTMQTMEPSVISDRYEEKFGIEVHFPCAADKKTIDSIIFDELVKGVFDPNSKAEMLRIVDDLFTNGVDCLALSCTEICLLINQDDRPQFPMFDTTQLHAAAAVDFALAR